MKEILQVYFPHIYNTLNALNLLNKHTVVNDKKTFCNTGVSKI